MQAGNGARLRRRQMRFDESPGSISLGVGLQHSTLKRFHHRKK
jgi:hypothetical protein